MSDLRLDGVRMQQLTDHLIERESEVLYFYCDHRGLVTIAVGFLVDKDGAPDSVGRWLAKQLAVRPGIVFRTLQGTVATPTDIETDWSRVKVFGRAHPHLPAVRYTSVAQLRIDKLAVRTITQDVVGQFIDDLYRKRAFMLSYDPRVVMALVDVRFNPAGLAMYDHHGPVARLWNALDPGSPAFNLAEAMNLFEGIWAHRATERYGLRHYQRAKWMREGLQAMNAAAPQSV